MHDRELKCKTLQVPEVHVNPKQRCTCPKLHRALSLSPSPSPSGSDGSRRPSPRLSDQEIRARSLTPELPQMRKRVSADSRSSRERSVSPVPHPEPQQQLSQPQPQQASEEPKVVDKKASKKDRRQLTESRRAMRSKWAVKPHFSLPAERKEPRWTKSHEDGKSKSLKERPKYSVRRSMSPDPDPRQVLRLDNRVVRRLISPEISLKDAKWAPYEGYSPLPNVGIRRRETKKVSDIKWEPQGESPIQRPKLQPESSVLLDDDLKDPPKTGDEFHNVTPTHLPPPQVTPPDGRDEDEEFRMRLLNQVAAFPLYQGAWREESPPPSPPPPELSTPVWSPVDANTVTTAQLRKQSAAALVQRYSPSPPPTPPQKRSTLKVRTSRKKAARAKSQDSTRADHRVQEPQSLLAPPPPRSILSRGSSEEPGQQRRRPQLLRSKALTLDVPKMEATKRSLSEEVRSYNVRSESTKRGLLSRAKSEDAARCRWYRDADPGEVREYVTTV